MPKPTKPRGGARKGAGRPKFAEPTVSHSIRLTKWQIERLKLLGGSKWIREQIALAQLD